MVMLQNKENTKVIIGFCELSYINVFYQLPGQSLCKYRHCGFPFLQQRSKEKRK